MPSSHSSSGGHFGGGSSHSFSHSSGHFGGSHSSSSHSSGHFGGSSGSFSSIRPIHRPWYRPRVVVIGGRQVYLGTGRASAFSILGVLVALAVIVTVFLGISWSDIEDTLTEQRDAYTYYQSIAEIAYNDASYRIDADVTSIEEYKFSGRWCINYKFDLPGGREIEGYSFFVYSFEEASHLRANGTVTLALDMKASELNFLSEPESVPLDYYGMGFEADEEYVANLDSRDSLRIGTFIMLGVSVALIIAAVLIPMTAKKATAEQIAANNQSNADANAQNQNTAAGTWRCEYCNTVNDTSKQRCDGCGAMRQK